jgi:drug/metabolite transporter (DMT)-like permease
MPLMVALLRQSFLREPFTAAKKIGLRADPIWAFAIAWGAGGEAIESRQTIGHLLFLGSALAWAFYTVAMRRARLCGLPCCGHRRQFGALILYMPAYLMVAGLSLALAPWGDVALQAFVQGILTAIVSLIFYGRAVSILGASSGAAVRRAVASHDGCHGDSNSRRVADRDGLDCHRRNFRQASTS